MTESNLKSEFEIRTLKRKNELMNMQLKNAEKKINARLLKETDELDKKYKKQLNDLKRQVSIGEDLEQRLNKKLEQKNQQIYKKNEIIKEQKNLIKEYEKLLKEKQKEIDALKNTSDEYKAALELDGTTAGISTSQTPINKDKLNPNTREKSGKSKGGQVGHSKHKLEAFNDEEINEVEEEVLKECPHCHSKKLKDLGTSIDKDEFDYEIKIIKRRHKFKEYECGNCHRIVKKNIPNNLKEENQYGSQVQAHILSLTNVANVPFNKTRRIITGLTSNEINLSEGYIAKLQERASEALTNFIQDLKNYVLNLSIVHWDDTVIFVDKKRACLRFYGDNDIALYTAHSTKSKKGLDEDNILDRLTTATKVVHDHNTVNYNEQYVYVNVECCQHLERDLERVKLEIPESTWSKELKNLFSSYNKQRKEYIKSNIYSFTFEETNDFMIKFDECILLGIEEHKTHGKSHYYQKEKALLERLEKYRDNYTYWLYDFSIPYTNNTAERGLRGVKTKMKVSGQFNNIKYAKYYANIRSYTETCHRNGINEIEALARLVNGNPFTIEEITTSNKEKSKNN